MNCRQFESNLADYIAGRLNPSDDTQMHTHSLGCPVCAVEEKRERAVRLRFVEAPVVPAVTNLWPLVVAQLPERRPRFAFSRLWLTAPALTAVAAAILLFSFTLRPIQNPEAPFGGGVRTPVDTQSNSSLASMTSVREIGIPESEMLLEETDSSRQLGRTVAAEGDSL